MVLYNDLSSYSRHDLYGFSAKYTDDTQMTIAIVGLMLNNENLRAKLLQISLLNALSEINV